MRENFDLENEVEVEVEVDGIDGEVDSKKVRKQAEKGYVTVTDEIRIMVEDDNVKTIQIANGEKDGEIVWKNDGHFGTWSSVLKDLHETVVTKHLIRKVNSNLLELKASFDETSLFLRNQFKKEYEEEKNKIKL